MEHHMMETKPDNPVNIALGMPKAKEFERDLTAMLVAEEGVVLVMQDCDCFIRVNDKFGREEGDRVLVETGKHVAASVPSDAKVYRYGGDAFAVIFPATYEKEDVFLLMEKLRASYDVTLPDGDKMTISIGISAAPEDASQYNELVRKAEGAMCRGKVAGRNKVCLAREEKMVVKTTHYTMDQLQRLTKLSRREGTSEAILLREALDGLLKKYDV
ncbi:MAG: diguanylate cyclase [Eubacteriales bacterium]|nr:diguanylate cyclase [Eubacteriales bacterium]MDD3882279.1 diguanylate cyclase [Eubacteriales bacterium]MDD4512025.1 diguanylate cyclase [Eubacteriales bacterium]